MLEIHSMGGGDPRLRPQNQNQNHNYNYNQLQPLKCPRCDSLNTKFCYYNNYNLSQPRHFCKNCRRYWTKGGVLRNVPVGGGCRKSKRSTTPKTTTNNPSSSSDTAPAIAPTTPPPAPPSHPTEPERNSNSHSSSESFSLTVAATEAVSAPTSNSVSNNNVRESKLFSLEQGHHSGIFSEIGTFTSLIASNNEPLGFGFGTNSNNNNNNSNNNNILDATSFRFGVTHDQVQGGGQGQWQQQSNQDFGTASFFDHTVPVEFSSSLLQHKSAGRSGGFGSLDWQQGADQGLFDLPNTVDQTYWSHTHWSDQDNQTLFHLP